MTAMWMIYGSFVSFLLGLAAWLAEAAARQAKVDTRWIWVSAMVLTIVVIASAPLRRQPFEADVRPALHNAAMEATLSDPGTRPDAILETRLMLRAAGTGLVSRLGKVENPRIDRVLTGGWLVASLLLLALVGWTLRTAAEVRARCTTGEIQGTSVLISGAFGPAVLGMFPPRIVVGAWLLERTPEEQMLVLAHEREHVTAGDSYLLLGSALLIAILPWLLPLWWIASRLRLAIEIDCDRRVLEDGHDARRYGRMLVDLGSTALPISSRSPVALAGLSQLETRIRAMMETGQSRSTARWAICLPAAVMLTAGAFSADVPPSVPADVPPSEAILLSASGLASTAVRSTIRDGRRFNSAADAEIQLLPPQPGGANAVPTPLARNAEGVSDLPSADMLAREPRSWIVRSGQPGLTVTIQIRAQDPAPPAFRIEGGAERLGGIVVARTPFTFVVDTETPYQVDMTSSGDSLLVEMPGSGNRTMQAIAVNFGLAMDSTGIVSTIADRYAPLPHASIAEADPATTPPSTKPVTLELPEQFEFRSALWSRSGVLLRIDSALLRSVGEVDRMPVLVESSLTDSFSSIPRVYLREDAGSAYQSYRRSTVRR